MTAPVIKNPFVHVVVSEFIDRQKGDHLAPITWVQEQLFNPECKQDEVENFARGLLLEVRSSVPKNDSKRYQFRPPKASDDLLKVVFETSFQHNPQRVIREAERSEGSFYPLWRRVGLIYAPKTLSVFLGNFFVKIAISIVAGYFSYQLGSRAFIGMIHFYTARAIPFVINHAPLGAIRIGNRAMDVIDWTRSRTLNLLIYAFCFQQIVLLVPRIPYLTALIEAVSIWDIGLALFASPQTSFWFFFKKAMSTAEFFWGSSASLSTFFSQVAVKAESDRLAISKSKSYALWKKMVAANIPKTRS
jgi:hypothetical protein